uniref:ZAD domain-containing protein n=1 Tax=Cacopsylla melanoneura TaxID=428564 RepID=A0A8D8WNP6_9HEMI
MSEAVMQTSCRLCLEHDDNLMNVFDVPDLDKLIYQCVCIKIVLSDSLPTDVCFKCIGELQNWMKFKKTCDDSQKTLLKHCKKSTMPSIRIQNIQVNLFHPMRKKISVCSNQSKEKSN